MGGYYEELGRHPSPHRWAGWRGPLDHALRFELALAGVWFPPAARGAGAPAPAASSRGPGGGDRRDPPDVLDLGCGSGELAEYLAATGRPTRYRGVDVSGAAIALGRERHPGAILRVADLRAPGPPAHLVVAVGAMVSGDALTADGVRRRALARVVAAAWRHAVWRATVVVLDQATLEAHPGWRAEPALGGARATELARLGRHLSARWEVRRSPVGTDLALTIWRAEAPPEARPTDDELVARALSSPWGRSASAEERAWLDRERGGG